MRRLYCGLVLAAAGFACNVSELGKIPCNDTSNCPSDYPTCSAAGFCVNSAPAGSIVVVSGDAQTAVVGTALAQTLVVRVLDTNGNAVPNFTVTWSASTGGGQVSSGSTNTGPDGKASITARVGNTSGGYTYTATGAGLTGSPKTFTATAIADVATTLVVSGPTSTTAGVTQSYTVTAKDQFGNVATGYSGTVHAATDNPNATVPPDHTFTLTEAGVHAFPITLKGAADPQIATFSITATDTVTATIHGSQAGIVVNPATAVTLQVVGFPTSVTAGVGGFVIVSALDAFANTASGYRGTVLITSSDVAAAIPANPHTYTATDAGVHTFSVTLKTAANSASIIATDTGTMTITGNQTGILVNPGATAKLLVSGYPSSASADTGGSVTVTAKDANNNTTPTYTGTVQFTSMGQPTATLPADYTFTTGIGRDNGVHTFSGVVLTKASPPTYSITVKDAGNANIAGSQTGITVNPGATTKLQVAGFPSTVFAGTPGSVTVTAQDANNNTTPLYAGTVQIASSDTAATDGTATPLPLSYTFTALDAGVHVFTVILNTTSGGTSITATDTPNALTGNQMGIVVTTGPLVFGATATLIVSTLSTNGLIFIAGGSASTNGASPLSNTWFYNPANSALTAGPTLASPRSLHTATAIGGGQVLIAGGSPGSPTGFTEFELCSLDGLTPSCAASGTLATFRCNAAAALVSATQVLIAGGDNCASATALQSWDLWDSGAAPVSSGASNKLTVGRRLLTATVVGTGKVLLAGGNATSATADVFTLNSGTPASSMVSPTASAPTAGRLGQSATLLTSVGTACPNAATAPCVLLAGGNSTAGKTWEIYAALTDSFPINAGTGGPPNHDLLLTTRQFQAATAFANGKVLIAGGASGGSAQSSTEVFDPAATPLSFTAGSALQLPRFKPGAAYAPVLDVLALIGGNSVGPSTEQVTAP
ncbi:MAG TPA: Ig-like domain-containing protein [Myxococcales bacterium]|nr:Ig-like domain-containing protein [Myxococcales bacterium]